MAERVDFDLEVWRRLWARTTLRDVSSWVEADSEAAVEEADWAAFLRVVKAYSLGGQAHQCPSRDLFEAL